MTDENEVENGVGTEALSTELTDLAPKSEYEATVQASGDNEVYADSGPSDAITFTTIRAFGVQYSVYETVVAAAQEGQNWNCVYEVIGVDSDNKIRAGQAVTILARVFDAFAPSVPLLNTGANVAKISYTCERKMKGIYNQTWTAIEGHENVEVDSTCLLDALENCDNWTQDDIGFNFMLTPDITEYPIFPELGAYRIVVRIEPVDGNPIVFYNYVTVVDDTIDNSTTNGNE